jgi:hypothetical protein
LYLNGGAAVTTFSTAGTEFGFNAPSGFAGNFFDLHLNGGVSLLSINSSGYLYGARLLTGTQASSGVELLGSQVQIGSAGFLAFSSSTVGTGTMDTGISRGAAGILDVGNGTAGNIAATLATTTLDLGASGTLGSTVMGNATSGTLTLEPATGALGTVTVSIPAATDTLVNLAGTQTLSNKTLVAPALGTPASGVVTNLTGTGAFNTTGFATSLGGGAVGSAPYQSAANTSTFIASPTTSGHTFAYVWQPSGSAVAPTALDLATYLASPPAIGGTAAAAGNFTTLAATGGITAISDGVHAGQDFLSCNTTNPATVANAQGWTGSTGGATCTSYGLNVPTAAPTANQLMVFPAPTSSFSQGTWITAPAGTIVGTTDTQTLTNKTLTAPALGAATASSLLASGIVDGQAPITVTTAATATLGGTYNSGYTFNEEATAATAITYTLPTAAAGKQYCVGNAYNGSAANTGTLELLTSASGQFIIFTDGTLSATGGYVISAGAARDSACVVGVDATHWILYVYSGTWVKH